MSFYQNAKKLTSFLAFIFHVRGEGAGNLPESGPVILCSNHRSNTDPILLGIVLPRSLFFMAKQELFRIPLLRNLITALGAFPVRRGMGDKAAIKTSYKILKEGKVLAMFPEGHRQKEEGPPKTFMQGVVKFAAHSGAPLLPAAILCRGRMAFYKRKVIRFGQLVTPEQIGYTDGSAENVKLVSENLRKIIADLMEEPF